MCETVFKKCAGWRCSAVIYDYDATEVVIDCWAKNQCSENDLAAVVLKCEIKRDVIVARRNSTAMMD